MRRTTSKTLLLFGSALLLASCGRSSAPATDHVVTLSWAANHESGVNKPGGGYRISISGRPTVEVPYLSGPAAPTTKDVTLGSGSYTVTVSAFAALDAQGGSTGSQSAPSQTLTVNVP
jgi:hypothetical protein